LNKKYLATDGSVFTPKLILTFVL